MAKREFKIYIGKKLHDFVFDLASQYGTGKYTAERIGISYRVFKLVAESGTARESVIKKITNYYNKQK